MESPLDPTRRLLSLVVHELRAPAGVVSGYLRMLARSAAPRLSETDRRMIDDASRNCARLLRVVKEIEDLVDLDDSAGAKPVSPVPVFRVCEEAVREAAANGGALTFVGALEDRSALVRAEPDLLRQSFATLIALTLRERGGLPVEVVGFLDRDQSPPRVVIVFGREGATVQADALAAQANDFDRWRGGMGLVVPIASRILEGYGGRLWSLPGTPAACAVNLPLAAAEQPPTAGS